MMARWQLRRLGLLVRNAAARRVAAALLLLCAIPAHALVPTVTTLVSSLYPSVYTNIVTFTATVSGVGPTGSVTFKDGATTLGSGAVAPATGIASFTTTVGAPLLVVAGGHKITAVYSGDGVYATSTSAQLTQTVNQHATITAATALPTPVTYGTIVALSATVTGSVPTPTGTVAFKDGGVTIFTANVAAGAASVGTAALAVGLHNITAVYSGDVNNLASTSGIAALTVLKGNSTTTLSASPNPQQLGKNVQLTATIGGGPLATGSVQFIDGSLTIGTVAVAAGTASLQVSTLALGSHGLSAVYSGNANMNASSGLLTMVISPATSGVALTSSLNPSQTGQAVTFTATVTGNLPGGMVSFMDGAVGLGSAALNASGVATLTTSSLAAGGHIMTASYSGDANNSAATSTQFTQTVTAVPLSISSSANPSASGQSVTFTVTVNGSGPTGTVTLFDNGNSLGDLALAAGVASYTTKTLGVGTHSISARYNGDGANPTAFSPIFTQTVSGTAPVPLTGLWWNPAEGGRGYTIEQRGNNLFMATYLYDASGRSTWYGLGPAGIAGGVYQGNLTSYAAGQTLTGAYQVATVVGPAGAATVTFSSPTQATLAWPEGTIPLQKLDFGPGGSAATQPAGTPEAGWWWAPTEGGRGYSIEIQGGIMYLAAYMYDAQGNPVWYASGPVPMTNATTYQGTWQQYGNGQTLTGTWHAPQVTTPNAGNVTIQFSSTTTGTLTLPDGKQVAIQRFVF